MGVSSPLIQSSVHQLVRDLIPNTEVVAVQLRSKYPARKVLADISVLLRIFLTSHHGILDLG